MRSNHTVNAFFKRRFLKKNSLIGFYWYYIGPNYYVTKGSFMFNKFFKRFFNIYLIFLKKFYIFVKLSFLKSVFYNHIFLKIKKMLFGNVWKYFSRYEQTAVDQFFFFFKRRELRGLSQLHFYSNFFYGHLWGGLFYIMPEQIALVGDTTLEVDNFFFKGCIYSNYIYTNVALLEVNNYLTKSLDFIVQYNFFFVVEIYKLHIFSILQALFK